MTEKRLQKLILCRNKLGKSKKSPDCSSGGDRHWTFGSRRNPWKMEHILCYLTIHDTNRLCTNPKHALGMCEGPGHSTKKEARNKKWSFSAVKSSKHFLIKHTGKKVYCRSLNHFETQNTGLY